jgi:hypothetical protein
MNAPAAFMVLRWLAWDTLRQAQASAIFWAMLAVSLLAIVFCATLSTPGLPVMPTGEAPYRVPPLDPEAKKAPREGVDTIDGELRFLFGAVRVQWSSYRDTAVRWVQLLLAGGVADTLGLLLALIWTSAFLPAFLEPAAATVLLAKPAPRWMLLAGKFLGVVLLVLFQAGVFVGGTWVALGLATGIWDGRYLLAVPLLVLNFTVFFSFSCLLAVWTRSSTVCIFGSLLFWALCWGMNYGRHAHLFHEAGVATGLGAGLELGYWILPKPLDLSHALSLALGAHEELPLHWEILARLAADGSLALTGSILSSLAFALAMLAAAAYELSHADY